MIRRNRILAGFVLAMLVVGALSGAAAIADEGVEEGVQQDEAPEEDKVLQLLEVEGVEGETSSPAEEPMDADPTDDRGDAESAGSPHARPRPAPRGDSGGDTAAATASSSAQPGEEGQGDVEIDPASAAGACPGGTALKIDNLRSNGTFGPITISNFTKTSFTWTSTQGVSAVLVKDGGGVKTNPGGSSGSASSLGQDISHVIFCLGGDVPDVDAETPEDEAPCDADETMPGTQPCAPAPCDADETMPGTQPCVESPCDADETMPGTQPCAPAPCDADETMPGRQDCNEVEDVAGVESNPEKHADDGDVEGAGLVADREPDAAPMAAQPVVQGTTLPFTGGQVAPLLMVALGFVTAGGGAILIRRP